MIDTNARIRSLLSRREFMRVSGLLASAFALSMRGCTDSSASAATDASAPPDGTTDVEPGDVEPGDVEPRTDLAAPDDATLTLPDTTDAGSVPVDPSALPTLGGAPDTHDGRVIAAFIDTVVPGQHRDPEGKVGGIDVGAPGMFFDPDLPAAPFLPLLVVLLDAASTGAHPDRTFDQLTPAEREQVLTDALAATPLLDFAVQLGKLAFFSSEQAGLTLGYPGPNPGYVNDTNLSFGTAITTELTIDGNYP